MFAFFLIVLLVPLTLAGFAFVFLHGVTLKEFGLVALATLVVAGASAGVVSCSNTHDVEVWNGRVARKAPVRVSCEHSYQCNCVESCTPNGKYGESCTTICQTCYEHPYDVDWRVWTTNGEVLNIARIDSQGVDEPPRFAATRVGEPTSLTHSFKNYIKASPGTLFRHQGMEKKYAGQIPKYPQGVYDYWHLDRLVQVGTRVDDPTAWNEDLSQMNADLGHRKQVNMILVLAKDKPHDWYYAVEQAWIGGKKNDAILFISVDGQMHPRWAQVMAWTDNEMFKVKLRDAIMDQKVITRKGVMAAFRSNVNAYYVRKPMADFAYLSSSITPTSTEWVVTLLLALLVAGGLTVFMQLNDVFGDEGNGSFTRRSRPFKFRPSNPFRSRRFYDSDDDSGDDWDYVSGPY